MVDGLKQIYQDIGVVSSQEQLNSSKANYSSYGKYEEFDQSEFVGIQHPQINKNWVFEDTHWNYTGGVYIPDSCYTTTCRLHVSIHGCWDTADSHASASRLREFATDNNIILLFP